MIYARDSTGVEIRILNNEALSNHFSYDLNYSLLNCEEFRLGSEGNV